MSLDGNVLAAGELSSIGIQNSKSVYWNSSIAVLYEQAVKRGEGIVADQGPFVVETGKHTGRSPNDKFVVREPESQDSIWWGSVNRSFEPADFDRLLDEVGAYLGERDLFVQDLHAGADADNRIGVRVVTERAWNAMFVRHLFLDQYGNGAGGDVFDNFTVIHAPGFKAEPRRHNTNSDAFILLHFGKRIVLIGGTGYAGETKKSIFTVMNYVLPARGVLSMHCSANYGPDNDVALFFGLSGTGKTSLSADTSRTLIGDDEHGWSDNGIFNVEGGCYAKMIALSPTAEPEIFATSRMFGTVLENVVYDENLRALDLDDDSITENTRGAYPVSYIPNSDPGGVTGHPQNILLLTADAFGVLPPIARLSHEQAMYYFLSGYTSKLAGTEVGIIEPEATFSSCFGAPFLPRPPSEYADLLGERLRKHRPDVWLVNTGWSGGPYGTGSRMPIRDTRAMVKAALDGQLSAVEFEEEPHFGLQVPKTCPDVDQSLLRPRSTWDDTDAYDRKAAELAQAFVDNFKQFSSGAAAGLERVGPRPS